MKKNEGITLIVLVITIILLLILAGVTIGQLTGNGLFDKVKLAKKKSDEAQAKENATLGDYENEIDKYVSGNRDSITLTAEQYDELINKTIVIDIIAPNTSGWLKVADYPDGYNINNCSVIGCRIYSELWDKQWYVVPGATSTNWALNITMREDGIYLYLWGQSVEAVKNQPGKIILTKF